MTRKTSVGVAALVSVFIAGSALFAAASPASAALTVEECEERVAAGKEARSDLAELQAALAAGEIDPSDADDQESGYVDDLVAAAAINEMGFTSPVTGGRNLEYCISGFDGPVTVTLNPVLFEGIATSDPFPLESFIPGDLACGPHTIEANGTDANGNALQQVQPFEINEGCASDAAQGILPVTGASAGMILAVGLALVAVGFAVLRASRAGRSAV